MVPASTEALSAVASVVTVRKVVQPVVVVVVVVVAVVVVAAVVEVVIGQPRPEGVELTKRHRKDEGSPLAVDYR